MSDSPVRHRRPCRKRRRADDVPKETVEPKVARFVTRCTRGLTLLRADERVRWLRSSGDAHAAHVLRTYPPTRWIGSKIDARGGPADAHDPPYRAPLRRPPRSARRRVDEPEA